jgi:hypothetical protein
MNALRRKAVSAGIVALATAALTVLPTSPASANDGWDCDAPWGDSSDVTRQLWVCSEVQGVFGVYSPLVYLKSGTRSTSASWCSVKSRLKLSYNWEMSRPWYTDWDNWKSCTAGLRRGADPWPIEEGYGTRTTATHGQAEWCLTLGWSTGARSTKCGSSNIAYLPRT